MKTYYYETDDGSGKGNFENSYSAVLYWLINFNEKLMVVYSEGEEYDSQHGRKPSMLIRYDREGVSSR